MDLRRIRYFVTLAETLHFGRAALRLHIAQPPLSHQIRVLEDELGARLFDRTNRRVELTPAGHALLPEARALLAQAEKTAATAARAQRGELGELRIGFTSTSALNLAIPHLILAYRRRWPGVSLRIEELTSQGQLAAMLERRLDIAFVRSPQPPDLPAHLRAILLLEDALVAALPPHHPLSNGHGPLPMAALSSENFILYPQDSGTGIYDQIIALCRRAGFAPHLVQEARSLTTIVGLVAAGLGIALVPDSTRSIATNGVIYRPLEEPAARSAMWAVLREGEVSVQELNFRTLIHAHFGQATAAPPART